jgi:hypothetical protein
VARRRPQVHLEAPAPPPSASGISAARGGKGKRTSNEYAININRRIQDKHDTIILNGYFVYNLKIPSEKLQL